MRKLSRAKALELCVAAWGKDAAVEDRSVGCAGTPESRAAASAELAKLRREKPTWLGLQDTVTFPDSMTLAEYRAAHKLYLRQAEVWRALESDAQSRAMRQRYQVGKVMGGFAFHVKGRGDSWEEALKAAGVLQPDGIPYSWAHWNRPNECTCIKHTEERINRTRETVAREQANA